MAGITDKDALLTVYDVTTGKNIIADKAMQIDKDGIFSMEISVDKSLDSHKLVLAMKDNVGNVTEKEVQVINDAMGSIDELMIYADDKDVTNDKLASNKDYELTLRAKLTNGDVITINNATLVEWSHISAEGNAAISKKSGKIYLSAPSGSEGIVTAKLLVQDNGTYPVSVAFGPTNTEQILLTKDNLTVEISDMPYTGKEVIPDIKVLYQGVELVRNSDYTVSYKDNIEVGVATVIILGKGKYTGQVIKTFNIIGKVDTGSNAGGNTGDLMNPIFYMAVLIVAGGVAFILANKRKKKTTP